MPHSANISPQERFIYALTSNGDWMAMSPQTGADSDPYVAVLAVSVGDRDELYEAAEAGDGELLGRLVIRDGKPVFVER